MKDEKVLENLKNAKDILVEGIQDFTRKQKEVMTEYYLYNLTHSYMDSLIVDNKINPNDKIVDRNEIISEFKKNAEFKEEFEPETGFREQVWVVNDDFKKLHDPKTTKVLERMQDLKYEKIELQELIFSLVSAETKNGIKVDQGSAIELIEMLDQASYVDSLTSRMKIKIASLADNEAELEGLRYRVEDESREIINYKLLGDKKYMLEFAMSDNNAYSLFPEWLKNSLIDHYYQETKPFLQLSLMSTTATIDRKNISMLANDIMKKSSGREFDLVDHPEIYDNFIHYEGILKNISSSIKEDVEEGRFRVSDMERYISPITTIILIGGLDRDIQKQRFGQFIEGFEHDLNNIERDNPRFDSNYVRTKIDTMLDEVSYERSVSLNDKKEAIIERAILDEKYKEDLPKEILEESIRNVISSVNEGENLSNKFMKKLSKNKDNEISKRIIESDGNKIGKIIEKIERKKNILKRV